MDGKNQKREEVVKEIRQYLEWQEPYFTPSEMADTIKFGRVFMLSPSFTAITDQDSQKIDNRKNYDADKFLKLRKHSENDIHLFNALSKISARWISECEDLPTEIREFVSAYLRGELKPPKKPKGKKTDLHKRLVLAMSVYKVMQKGYPAGRNDETDNEDNAFNIGGYSI